MRRAQDLFAGPQVHCQAGRYALHADPLENPCRIACPSPCVASGQILNSTKTCIKPVRNRHIELFWVTGPFRHGARVAEYEAVGTIFRSPVPFAVQCSTVPMQHPPMRPAAIPGVASSWVINHAAKLPIMLHAVRDIFSHGHCHGY